MGEIAWRGLCRAVGGFFGAFWLAPGLLMLAALLVYIIVMVIHELRK